MSRTICSQSQTDSSICPIRYLLFVCLSLWPAHFYFCRVGITVMSCTIMMYLIRSFAIRSCSVTPNKNLSMERCVYSNCIYISSSKYPSLCVKYQNWQYACIKYFGFKCWDRFLFLSVYLMLPSLVKLFKRLCWLIIFVGVDFLFSLLLCFLF